MEIDCKFKTIRRVKDVTDRYPLAFYDKAFVCSNREDQTFDFPQPDLLGSGLLEIPLLGTYAECYTPLPLLMLVQLQPASTLLPAALRDALLSSGLSLPASVHLCLHAAPRAQQCQHFLCDRTDEISAMFHFCCFQGDSHSPASELSESPSVGLFEPYLVAPAHQEEHRDPLHRGIPFRSTARRLVQIHDGSCSPCNNQLSLPGLSEDAGEMCRSFWLLAITSRGVFVSYHLIPTTVDLERRYEQIIGQSISLSDIFEQSSYLFEKLKDFFPIYVFIYIYFFILIFFCCVSFLILFFGEGFFQQEAEQKRWRGGFSGGERTGATRCGLRSRTGSRWR